MARNRLTHEQAIDNLVSLFETEVDRIVAEARRATLAVLQDRLATTRGVIDRTQANARLMQRVEQTFTREMKRAGYDSLVREYIEAFNGQFAYFQDTLDLLSKGLGKELKVSFGQRDKAVFLQQQGMSADLLHQAVTIQAQAAQRQAMYNVGGVRASELSRMISQKLDLTSAQASGVADTALSTFYRTIADRGMRQVERQLADDVRLRYTYGGPRDKLNRVFCKHALAGTGYADKRVKVLAREGTGYTRAQIDKMANGQLPNVFLTCGGYRCRHQWVPVLKVDAK